MSEKKNTEIVLDADTLAAMGLRRIELEPTTNPTPGKTWSELIRCPECKTDQWALVEQGYEMPFATYIHDCQHCGHTILESEWNKVGEGDALSTPAAELEQARDYHEEHLNELETQIDELKAQLSADRACLGGLDTIFQSGDRQAEINWDNGADAECPYAEGTAERCWWTRGYSYKWRILRALKAEAGQNEARSRVGELETQIANIAAGIDNEIADARSEARRDLAHADRRIAELESLLGGARQAQKENFDRAEKAERAYDQLAKAHSDLGYQKYQAEAALTAALTESRLARESAESWREAHERGAVIAGEEVGKVKHEVARLQAAANRLIEKAQRNAQGKRNKPTTIDEHFKVFRTLTIQLDEEDVKGLRGALESEKEQTK